MKTSRRKFLALTVIILVITVYSIKNFKKQSTSQIEVAYTENKEKLESARNVSYTHLQELNKRDRPDLAFLQDYEMTKDPKLGYPPVQRRLEAFNTLKQKAKQQMYAAISSVNWVERGPASVGGRTRALMFDPNDPNNKKVWAGAIGGGLWFTDDITSTQAVWQNVGDVLANLAISSLAYDPTNPQVFYMGTGLGYTSDIQGDGIFKSTDGGSTWTQLASTKSNSNFYFVQKIDVTNQGTILATTRTGIYRSTDGGASWTEAKAGRFGDIEIAANDSIYITQGVNSNGAIYKSSDDGLTWNDITPASGRRMEIASAPSNPDVLYAIADGGSGNQDVAWIKKSIDGGATWDDLEIPVYLNQDCTPSTDYFTRGQAWFDLAIAVSPLNEDVVIIGGIDLHKTEDGGVSWYPISYWTGSTCDAYVHADQHAMAFRPNHPEEAIFGNDGGVFYSNDVASAKNPNIEARNNGYNVTTFYSAATRNDINSNYFLAGAQDNGTQQFTEPGFGETHEATGGDGAYCFIDQDNGDIQISSFVYSNFYFSTDGGVTFTTLNDDQSNTGRFINPTEYDDAADIFYATAGFDKLSRIENISGTPTSLATATVDLGGGRITTIKHSSYTDNLLFIGADNGNVYKVQSANTSNPTTTLISSGIANGGSWVSSIDIGTSDNQLLVTYSNYGVSSVFETTNGGSTWVDKEDNLPDIPVRWGLYNPLDTKQVLLATEIGVWSTNDISASNPGWEATNSGLANVRCDMLKYRAADQTVVVATFGRGLFTTNVFATTTKADFKTDQVVGYVGVPVQFQDASLLPNNDWSWNFGDGSGTSTAQNPSYTYAAPGTYDVSLSIDTGADTETKTGYVIILPVKATPYTAADGGDFESNPNDYVGKALHNGVSNWELGVPTNQITTVNSGTIAWKTDLDADITDLGYDYKSALYTPAFDLSDATKNYTLKFRKSVSTVFCNGPQAMQLQYSTNGGATWTRLGSSYPEYGAVNWYNRGDNTGCSINRSLFTDKIGWSASNVAGGTDNTVHNENTEFSLNSLAGQANVSFRFVSSVGSGFSADAYKGDGFMIDDFEVLTSNPVADFTADETTIFEGQSVQFLAQSNGVQTYNWDFGDGSAAATIANPTHVYATPGVYTVVLTITSATGNDTQTKADFVSVLAKRGSTYTLADGGNFETNTSDFAVQHVAGTTFELGSSSIAGKDGTASGTNAWVTGINESQYVDNSDSRLITPGFDFSNLGQYTLEFKANYQFEDTWDGFIVEYTTDLGTTWKKLNPVKEAGWYTTTSDPQSVFGASVPIFSGTTGGQFQTFSTDVSDLAGNAIVAFRFKFLTDAATVDVGMALDDFILTGPSTGPATAAFSFTGNTGCEGQVVTFTNESTGSISALNWDFGANATPTTASGFGPHQVTYSGTGQSTVVLTVESSVNGTQVETKTDAISTAPNHTPTFSTEVLPTDNSQITLTASAGQAYQWYLNGDSIKTATNQTYTTNVKGNYKVAVVVDGCVGVSNFENIVTGLENDYFTNNLLVYPNPASNQIIFDFSDKFIGTIVFSLIDAKGAVYRVDQVNKLNYTVTKQVDVSSLKPGIYGVLIQFGANRTMRKILIK